MVPNDYNVNSEEISKHASELLVVYARTVWQRTQASRSAKSCAA